MRIGLIVDGTTEMNAFPGLCRSVFGACGHLLTKVLFAPIDGTQTPAQIAKSCEPVLRIHAGINTERCLIVLDRESTPDCPGDLANAIGAAVGRVSTLPTIVILKDRMVENWVVADLDAIAGMRARFHVTPADRRAVSPDRADGADALAMLKRMAVRKSYDKVSDGQRVLAAAEPMRIAANSRSFRRFLRAAGDPRYSTQSRMP